MKIPTDSLGGLSQSAREIVSLANLFKSFDKDKSRGLNVDEFSAFAKTLGLDGKEIFSRIDKAKSGKITFAQFKEGLSLIKEELFKKIDKNSDGVIDAKELEAFAKEYKFDPKKLRQVLAGPNADKISLKDFTKNFGQVLGDPSSVSLITNSDSKKTPSKSDSAKASLARARMMIQSGSSEAASVLDSFKGSKNGKKLDFFW